MRHHVVIVAALLATIGTGDGLRAQPATELDRLSWDEPCEEIQAHLETALDRNDDISADRRQAIADRLNAADPSAERAACLEPLKDAYDRLVAAYGATGSSANILGGASSAPSDPAAVTPERVEGPRTGERVGENPSAFD